MPIANEKVFQCLFCQWKETEMLIEEREVNWDTAFHDLNKTFKRSRTAQRSQLSRSQGYSILVASRMETEGVRTQIFGLLRMENWSR